MIKADLPGVAKEDVKLELDRHRLTFAVTQGNKKVRA